MGHSIRDIEVRSNAGDLTAEISDEELEAAAITTTHAVMSFPSAPTVSVVFMCCGNEYPPEKRDTKILITVRLPPPDLPGGISGTISSHSWSVTSLG
jgi:hypothetical protein